MFRKLRAEAERENGKENKLMFDNRALFALLLPNPPAIPLWSAM